jgi:hypothetical protein
MTGQHVARDGVIYVAFGLPYLIQALYSIETLRRVNPTLPAVVVTNCPAPDILPPHTSLVVVDAPNALNREYKSSVHHHSPFERSLFIDCDTEIKTDPAPGFAFLDKADVALRPEPLPFNVGVTEMDPVEMERLTREIGEFNTGVIFFSRSERAKRLMDTWHDCVKQRNDRDQKHFVRALSRCPDSVIWPLSIAWNYMRADVRMHRKQHLLRSDPYVWHYMDYSYAPSALRGVFRIARQIGAEDTLRNWRFVKRQILRPYLTRYFFLRHIDGLRKRVRHALQRVRRGFSG